MMDKLLEFLKDIVPIQIAALIVIFIYFLKVFKDLAGEFIKISQQQAEYMKQRVESVDKTTSIFERTVQHQEKDLQRLYELNEKLKDGAETKKEQEIGRLDAQLNDIVSSIEELRQQKLSRSELEKLESDIERAKQDTTERYTALMETLERSDPIIEDEESSAHQRSVFVVMPYTEEAKLRYEIVKKTLHDQNFKVFRADETMAPNVDIASHIRNCIESADIILVDISGRNASVMYELGYTHALQKPVVLLSTSADDIPFDVSNYRVIVFDHTSRGMHILQERLKEALTGISIKTKKKTLPKWIDAAKDALPYSDIINIILRTIA